MSGNIAQFTVKAEDSGVQGDINQTPEFATTPKESIKWEYLTCVKCKDLVRPPVKQLQCSHSMCEVCVDGARLVGRNTGCPGNWESCYKTDLNKAGHVVEAFHIHRQMKHTEGQCLHCGLQTSLFDLSKHLDECPKSIKAKKKSVKVTACRLTPNQKCTASRVTPNQKCTTSLVTPNQKCTVSRVTPNQKCTASRVTPNQKCKASRVTPNKKKCMEIREKWIAQRPKFTTCRQKRQLSCITFFSLYVLVLCLQITPNKSHILTESTPLQEIERSPVLEDTGRSSVLKKTAKALVIKTPCNIWQNSQKVNFDFKLTLTHVGKISVNGLTLQLHVLNQILM